jgi:hypothetical protein
LLSGRTTGGGGREKPKLGTCGGTAALALGGFELGCGPFDWDFGLLFRSFNFLF